MYGLKIADQNTDQNSFGPVPKLVLVKIIWSSDMPLYIHI